MRSILVVQETHRGYPEFNRNDMPIYTVAEVAQMTGFSRQTITRLFENEPGVLIIEHVERLHKRGYRSIRIPTAVYERVIRRITVK
jgi:hypothetical protein